ncbi:MAG: 4Fe-4S dicluster domain-containing protein [Verrucomicrobia bacterium]|nr:MAG: 4Fe-4S dicluster domain-containing protein [Verrucomicrobiota bacterium]
MKQTKTNRREALKKLAGLAGAVAVAPKTTGAEEALRRYLFKNGVGEDYDPFDHKWLMVIDIERCIGCGMCVRACKAENEVPRDPLHFRTWVEQYTIKKADVATGRIEGETIVRSPNGGYDGFPPPEVPEEEILRSFFVPKLCNLCHHSPCSQVCPVGATFDTPDGAVLVDYEYCMGCGFCVQACPYGCRYMHPERHTADKCTLCYHRITRGLKPACVEVCPTQARIFGDLKHLGPDDPLRTFIETKKAQSLKPHLGTEPRVLYAGLDKEVR